MKKFKNISSAEEMREYLINCLNRHNEDEYLLHYSSLETVINIFETGYFWLGDYNYMNDLFERELLNQCQCDGTLFYMCFSKGSESLAMYKMYGKGKSSVVLKIPIPVMREIISNAGHKERVGGIDDDGKESAFIRKINIVENEIVSKNTVETRLYCTDIAYINPYNNKLKCGKENNELIETPLNSNELVGMLKYDCWEYEQEVRLYGNVIDLPKSIKKLAVKLPKDFKGKVKVILGPEFDKELYHENLVYLRRLGIICENSIYDGWYKETNNKIASWNKYLLEDDYINKSFSGKDPWGGKLYIKIEDYRNGELIWKWKNIFNEGRKKHIIEEDIHTIIDYDFVGHYEINHRKRISKDEKEYLSYCYSGSILLVENKIIVTFNSGGTCNYLLGGAGAAGYNYSGSWRMGINLLSILTEEV